MFWECFSFEDAGSLFPVQKIMKRDQYIKILPRKAIPNMQKVFLAGGVYFPAKFGPMHCSKCQEIFFAITTSQFYNCLVSHRTLIQSRIFGVKSKGVPENKTVSPQPT